MTASVKTNVTRIAAIAMAAFLLTNATGAYAAGCLPQNDTTRSLSSTTTNDNDWDEFKVNVKGYHCDVRG